MAHGSLKDTKTDVKGQRIRMEWTTTELVFGTAFLFPNGRSAYVTSRLVQFVPWRRVASALLRVCRRMFALCPRASVDSTQHAFTLTDLRRCRIPGPWVKFSSSPKLCNCFCSAIVEMHVKKYFLGGSLSLLPPRSLAQRLNVSLLINYVKMSGESWRRHQSSELCVVSAYTGA